MNDVVRWVGALRNHYKSTPLSPEALVATCRSLANILISGKLKYVGYFAYLILF